MWNGMDPHLLLFMFLPALLFGEAMSLNFHHVRGAIVSATVLALPGALFGAFSMAVVAKYLLPYNWSWSISFVVGAILCATDPVAVVALLKTSGASNALTYVIIGEALINDGSALVLYNLFYSLVEYPSPGAITAKEVAIYFLRVIFISPLLGFAFGMASVMCLGIANRRMKEEDTTVQMAITICCAYLSFFVAEDIVKVSGVICCCSAALTLSRFAAPLILKTETLHSVWAAFEWIGNSLIFILAGLIIGSRNLKYLSSIDLAYILLVYVFTFLIRAALMLICYPLLQWSYVGKPLDWRECVFATWGGLRGAVSMALALSLVHSTELGQTKLTENESHSVFFIVGGVAALTLLINATTASPLLKALGLLQSNDAVEVKILRQYANKRLQARAAELLEQLRQSRPEQIDKDLVTNYCSILRYEIPNVEPASTASNAELGMSNAATSVHRDRTQPLASATFPDMLSTDRVSSKSAIPLRAPFSPLPVDRFDENEEEVSEDRNEAPSSVGPSTMQPFSAAATVLSANSVEDVCPDSPTREDLKKQLFPGDADVPNMVVRSRRNSDDSTTSQESHGSNKTSGSVASSAPTIPVPSLSSSSIAANVIITSRSRTGTMLTSIPENEEIDKFSDSELSEEPPILRSASNVDAMREESFFGMSIPARSRPPSGHDSELAQQRMSHPLRGFLQRRIADEGIQTSALPSGKSATIKAEEPKKPRRFMPRLNSDVVHDDAENVHQMPSSFSRPEMMTDLVSHIRRAFLDVVRVSYWKQINSGKLPRESYAALILLNSVDVALETTNTPGLQDWDVLEREYKKFFDKQDNYIDPFAVNVSFYVTSSARHHSMNISRSGQVAGNAHTTDEGGLELPNVQSASSRARPPISFAPLPSTTAGGGMGGSRSRAATRFSTQTQGGAESVFAQNARDYREAQIVYLLTAFIDAHHYAQKRIPYYLGNTETIDTPEEALVVKESRELVLKAKARLAALDPSIVRLQVSKQTARWILHREEDQIEEFLHEGIVTEMDAEHLLKEVEEDLKLLGKVEWNGMLTALSEEVFSWKPVNKLCKILGLSRTEDDEDYSGDLTYI